MLYSTQFVSIVSSCHAQGKESKAVRRRIKVMFVFLPQKKKHDAAQVRPAKIVQRPVEEEDKLNLEKVGGIPKWADKKTVVRQVRFALDKLNSQRAQMADSMPPLSMTEFLKGFPGLATDAAQETYEKTMPFSVRYAGLKEVAANTVPDGVRVGRWRSQLADFILKLNSANRRAGDPLVDINTFQKDYASGIKRMRKNMEPLDIEGREKLYQS